MPNRSFAATTTSTLFQQRRLAMAPASAPVTPDGKLYSTPARVPRTAHRLPSTASHLTMFSPLSSSTSDGSSPFSNLSLNTPQWSDRASSAFTTPESVKSLQAYAAQSPLARRSEDWRARATEHGIRVDRAFDDDESKTFVAVCFVGGG